MHNALHCFLIFCGVLLAHSFCTAGSATGREILQIREDEDVIYVDSFLELEQVFLTPVPNRTIQLQSSEILFDREIVIDVPGITIQGDSQDRTTIRCASGIVQRAFLIKCDHLNALCVIGENISFLCGREDRTTLRSIHVTECKQQSAVVIEAGEGQRGTAMNVLFENVEFHENGRLRHEIMGGAVHVDACRFDRCSRPVVRFVSCDWTENRGHYGGAIFAEDADLYIQNSSFLHNEADISGGAVYSRNDRRTSVRIEDATFQGNIARADEEVEMIEDILLARTVTQVQASYGMGGGITALNPLELIIQNCQFINNTAFRGGGGMAVVHGRFSRVGNLAFMYSISDSLFEDNRAFHGRQRDGLNFVLGGRNAYYGGAMMYESLADIHINWSVTNVTFVRNYARSGGAVSIQSVALARAQHRIVACRFEENVGLTSGGGILTQTAHVVLMRTTMSRNRAIYGAAISVAREAIITSRKDPEEPSARSLVENGIATFGGGIFAETPGGMNLSAIVFRNNTAFRYGGAIRLFSIANAVALNGVVIENNRALTGGGIACLALRIITIGADDNGRPSIFRNNTAATGGGFYYEPGHAIFLLIKIEFSRFVANKALSLETPEMQQFVEEGNEFEPLPEAHVMMPDIDEQLGNFTLLSFLTSIDEGHGGGLCLSLLNIRLFTIAEITFQNVTLARNEAIVGGALSVHMSDLYWNRQERSNCIPAAFGLDTCQRFVFYNVTVTKNRALYAGGVFSTLPDGISIACDSASDYWITTTDFISEPADPHQLVPYCTYVAENEISDGAAIEGADAGTLANSLIIEGWDGPLMQVASGDKLVVPCREDPFNASCFRELRIAVKDSFNQTIVRGIDDANLELTLISDAIIGDLRYMAVQGIAVINNTFAWGVSASSTLRVVSERDRNVFLEVELSTRGCYPGEITQVDICRKCPPEQYGFDPSHDSCVGCEPNARCHGGAALVPAGGYWHSTPYSPILHECIHPNACSYEGREENLTAYYDNATQLQEDLSELEDYLDDKGPKPDFEDYMQCAVGYEGVLCGSCQEGYGHSRTGSCEECPKETAREGGLIFLAAAWLFLLFGINCGITLLSMNTRVQLVKNEMHAGTRGRPSTLPRAPPIRSVRTSRIMRAMASGISQVSEVTESQMQDLLAEQVIATVQLAETLKILINYLQVTSSALHLRTQWNALLNVLLDAEAGLVGLSNEVIDVPFECNFEDNETPASISALWIRLATPWIILSALLAFFSLIWWVIRHRAKSSNPAEFSVRYSRAQYVTCIIIICIVSLYFSYIDIVRELLRAINCVEVAKEEVPIASDHPYLMYAIESGEERFWAEDTALRCYEGQHLPAGIVGAVGLVAAFGGIVLIVVWLPLNKKHVTKTEFVSRYWFLYQAYRKEWYTNAWESTILIRKALIAAVVVFSAHLGPTLQASLCSGILIIAHIMHTFFVPFKVPDDHYYLPEYAGDIFDRLHVPKLGPKWLGFNNNIHLNALESASLASSIVLFFSAIILHDSNSSLLGRASMVAFTLTVNIAFLLYMFYRLYAGFHVFCDLKLEVYNASFMAAHENSMSLRSLFVKISAMVKAREASMGMQKTPRGSQASVEMQDLDEEPPQKTTGL